MRKIVFCTIALLAATTVSIQAQTVRDVRRVKTTALSLYEKYVHSLGVLHDGGKYTGDNFIDLFVDPGEVIYNDIIPANHPQITNAYGYYTIYDSVIKYANYEYSGFRFNNPQKEGNKWVIDCFFTRTVSFNTRDSVYSHYPAWNFNYTMRITMDNQIAIVGNRNGIKEYDPDSLFANPKIVSITVDQPIEEYAILINKDYIPIRWHGEVVKNYDKECDCWMMDARKDKISDIKYDGDNLFLQLKNTEVRPNFYLFGLDKMNIGGVNIAFAPYGLGNQSDKRFTDIVGQNNSIKASLFYGIQLSNTLSNTLFLNLGVDAVYNTYTYSGTYEHNYNATDVDGDVYLRKVSATLNRERRSDFELIIPVMLNYVQSVYQKDNKQLFLYLKAGLFGGIRLYSAGKLDMSSRYTGLYSQYFDIEFDHYYDYGSFEMNQNNMSNYNMGNVNALDYGISGSLGVWYKLNRQYLLGFGIDFHKSFSPVLKYEEYEHLTTDYNHYESMLKTSDNGAINIYVGISLIKLLARRAK